MNRIRRQRAIEVGRSVDESLKSTALNSARQKELSNLRVRPQGHPKHGDITPIRVSVMVALGLHLIAVLLATRFIVWPTHLNAEVTIVDVVSSGSTDSRSVGQGICDIGEYHFQEYHFPRDGCLIPNPNSSGWWTPTPGFEKIPRETFKPLLKVTIPPLWLKKIEPEYPIEAKCAKKEGKVVLEATIDLDGKAKDIKVKGDDVGFGFARAAIDALEASLFTPAEWGFEIGRARVAVPYIFKFED